MRTRTRHTLALLAQLVAGAALLGACQGGGDGTSADTADGGVTPTTDGGGSSSGEDGAVASDGAVADASDAGGTTGGILPPGTIACATSACKPGLKYCDRNVGSVTGCVSTATPLNGCGSDVCYCRFPHARASCSATGACAMGNCDPGWADCDKDPSNGCEANLALPASCGACGTTCAQGQLCSPTGCVSACSAPLTACGSSCVNLATDARFCGNCTTDCGSDASAAGTCQGGTCVASCAPGYTKCGNGCVDLQADPANCGACGTPCAATETCLGGACTNACRLGSVACGTSCAEIWIDPKNCGACGNACGDGQSCVHGTCAATTSLWIATGTKPEDIVLDATHVYVSDLGDGSVRAVPKAGGAVVTIATGQANPRRLAVDATHVYWTNELGASVMRAPKDGSGMPELLSSANVPWGIVVDDAYVYWVDTGTVTIQKLPKAGGAPVTVVPNNGYATGWTKELSTDGTYLFTLVRRMTGTLNAYPWVLDKTGTPQNALLAAKSGPVVPIGGEIAFQTTFGSTASFAPLADRNVPSGHGCAEMALSSANACALFGTTPAFPSSTFGLMGNVKNHTVRPAIPSTTVVRIAADDANIYWTDKTTIGKIPLP